MIKNMDMVNFFGLTGGNIKDFGRMANNMEGEAMLGQTR